MDLPLIRASRFLTRIKHLIRGGQNGSAGKNPAEAILWEHTCTLGLGSYLEEGRGGWEKNLVKQERLPNPVISRS